MHDATAMADGLARFLTDQTGNPATVEHFEPMTGGYSRVMARARVSWADGSSDELVVRADPPAGQAFIETDRDVEWTLLRTLAGAGAVAMPAPRWYDSAGKALGTKTIVLDYCPGPSLQQVLDRAGADAADHAPALAATMGRVHVIDPSLVAGIVGRPLDWEAHLDELIGTFATIEGSALEAEPVLRYTAGHLDANRPPPAPLTVVHGDFQPANIMVGPDGGHLLVDWELCHIGDPREDLGYYDIYSAATGPNLYQADPEDFLARYRDASGLGEDVVNQETVRYFSAIAALRLWGQILASAKAMANGTNSGIMTTYTISALTIGRQNFLAACDERSSEC